MKNVSVTELYSYVKKELIKIIFRFQIVLNVISLINISQDPRDYCGDICVQMNLSHKKALNNTEEEAIQALKSGWQYVLLMCLVTLTFSYVFLILIRHAAKYVVWIINISFVVVAVVTGGIILIYGLFELGAALLIIGFILLIIITCYRNRIGFVAKLFKETSKALTDAPWLLFEPILVQKKLTSQNI